MNAPAACFEVTGIVMRAAEELGITVPDADRLLACRERQLMTRQVAEAMFEFIAYYLALLDDAVGDTITGGIHEPCDLADLIRRFPEDMQPGLLRELVTQFGCS